jgi:hypothetical protein
MRVLVATVWLLAGCDKLFTLTHVDDPEPGLVDAADEDAPGDMDADPCPFGRFGKYASNDGGLYRACLTVPPAGDYILPAMIDTRDETVCTERADQEGGGAQDICVISATNILINTPTRVYGSRPVVLVATETLRITSGLDASSVRGLYNGPGNNDLSCALTKQEHGDAGSEVVASGGGAGGTFQTVGGKGGNGEGGTSKGGTADQVPTLSFIRGGCPGGDGGLAGASTGSSGGTSGGAVYLIAGTSITLLAGAVVNASGAGGAGGGKGATRGGAGGGGGSGGLIGFDSPKVAIAAGARVLANGGGGGGSAGSGNGPAGNNGEPADITTAPFPALGATAVTAGGNGGNVSAPAGAGTNGSGAESGGGGGGGVGYIKIYTTQLTLDSSDISPTPNGP